MAQRLFLDDDKSEWVSDNMELVKSTHNLDKALVWLNTWLDNTYHPGDKPTLKKLMEFIKDAKDLINYYDPATDNFELHNDLLDVLDLNEQEEEDLESQAESLRELRELQALEEEADDLGMTTLQLEEANDQVYPEIEDQKIYITRSIFMSSR